MISIIICSKSKDISEQLKSNIEVTIGVQYELIVIDNSKQDYSIFSAYNEGIRRASFDCLCFMHEDIWYHSKEWGKKVLTHLAKTETGLIGLAGAYYLPAVPAPWFKAKPHVKNLIQSNREKNKPSKRYTIVEDKDVICVDGFWFCSRKNIFKEVGFDEKTFTGFHFYDLDISMQIYERGYSIRVISDITVEHCSGGTLNSQWIDSAYIFYNKWEKQLMINAFPALKKKPFVNTKAYRDLLYYHKKNHVPVSKEVRNIGWRVLKLNYLTAYLLYIAKML
ncbi:MAG: glycosyltransferase family protein [Dysgonamonadaceae bacterium]|jgi:GT2 family glycosyltransferase|nr:glycosyltransferase family protein [Dysgonamonadaceae bacterium]